jgi:hypothetical protein
MYSYFVSLVRRARLVGTATIHHSITVMHLERRVCTWDPFAAGPGLLLTINQCFESVLNHHLSTLLVNQELQQNLLVMGKIWVLNRFCAKSIIP